MSSRRSSAGYELIVYQPQDSGYMRRRLWFTAHVLLYTLFVLAQSALLPIDLLALALRSCLMLTILVHLYGMYSAGTRPLALAWCPAEVRVQPQPLLPEGQLQKARIPFDRHDLWYRWHDV
jgi:hypothetical protein